MESNRMCLLAFSQAVGYHFTTDLNHVMRTAFFAAATR